MEKERKITAPEMCEIEKTELVDGVAVYVRERVAKELKEFKEWKENKHKNERIIEIFGKKLKIIDSDRSAKDCIECALYNICWSLRQAVCETTEHKFNRYFIEIQ